MRRPSQLLWERARPLFAVLDGARAEPPDLFGARTRSLYESGEEPDLDEVAPQLIAIDENQSILGRLVEDGWGRAWGVFVSCHLPFEELRGHFRNFLKVRTEEGEELYFRFYDPRVLRVFLPTCTPAELEAFFGPIDAFWMEAEDPLTCLVFRRSREGLTTDRIGLGT
jgi:hypothetical protein